MTTAFHGGAFWNRIGDEFQTLGRRAGVINADVLDAWFDPVPSVVEALIEDVGWISRTSPPTHSRGLTRVLASRLDVSPESILVGAGSSSLIYHALGHWLGSDSRVLVPEPTYGEYAHYCQEVVGCRCDRLVLRAEEGFRLDLPRWLRTIQEGKYDLAVLVNPNNPTGDILNSQALAWTLGEVPRETRVLIDEAYIDYVGVESLSGLASKAKNVFVLKSLSKGLALSGLRAAYMVGDPFALAPLRARTPPWAVSLPAQMAAVAALREPAYYQGRYRQTESLRKELSSGLSELGLGRQFGTANWLLCELPEAFGTSQALVAQAEDQGLFLRNAGATAPSLGDRWVRIAVKDRATQEGMLGILGACFRDTHLVASGL